MTLPTGPVTDAEMAETKPRRGTVAQRTFDGRAVSRHPVTEQFHCMAYPCPNLTIWFYMPAWSHLCVECMMQREAQNAEKPPPAEASGGC